MTDAQDIAVAQQVKQSGLATPPQIAAALQLQAERAGKGAPLPLADALVQAGIITAAQKETLLQKLQGQKGVGALLHYKLLRKLGEGGMGAVYLADDPQAGRKVALKVLPRRYSSTPELLARFRREAETAARLRHPHIVGAYAAGEDAGFHFYVMEYCEGETLDRLLKRDKTLPVFKAVEIVLHAARGLHAAHGLGFIHRDIKPSNLILTPQGQAKVLDLGLTKNIEESAETFRTQSGAILGTPHYLSPEQARSSKTIDGRSDIYSLGATLYHLLAGEPPYPGATGVEVIYKHVHEPLPDLRTRRADVPAGVEQLLRKMLAKDPIDRHPTCAELIEDLEALLAGKAPPHATPEAEKKTKTTLRREPAARSRAPLWAAAGVAVAATAVGLFFALRPGPAPVTAPPRIVEAPKTIDLLKDVDPKRDAVKGLWTRQHGELISDDAAPSRLRLPFKPPASYDLQAEFTRLSGGDVVTLVLARNGKSFLWQMGGFGNTVCGFSKVDDRRPDDNPSTVKRGIPDGVLQTCLVEVRPERVTVHLGGKKIAEWTPALGTLAMDGDWSLKEDGALGLGSWGSPTTFHALTLTPR